MYFAEVWKKLECVFAIHNTTYFEKGFVGDDLVRGWDLENGDLLKLIMLYKWRQKVKYNFFLIRSKRSTFIVRT